MERPPGQICLNTIEEEFDYMTVKNAEQLIFSKILAKQKN